MISLAGAVLARLVIKLANYYQKITTRKVETMTDLDELRDLVTDFSNDLAQAEPEPEKWPGWIIFTLESLDNLTDDHQAFEAELIALRNDLTTRIEGGGW